MRHVPTASLTIARIVKRIGVSVRLYGKPILEADGISVELFCDPSDKLTRLLP